MLGPRRGAQSLLMMEVMQAPDRKDGCRIQVLGIHHHGNPRRRRNAPVVSRSRAARSTRQRSRSAALARGQQKLLQAIPHRCQHYRAGPKSFRERAWRDSRVAQHAPRNGVLSAAETRSPHRVPGTKVGGAIDALPCHQDLFETFHDVSSQRARATLCNRLGSASTCRLHSTPYLQAPLSL